MCTDEPDRIFLELTQHLPNDRPWISAAAGDFVTAEYAVFVEFSLEDALRCFTDSFMVLDTLSEELIIGATTMQGSRRSRAVLRTLEHVRCTHPIWKT